MRNYRSCERSFPVNRLAPTTNVVSVVDYVNECGVGKRDVLNWDVRVARSRRPGLHDPTTVISATWASNSRLAQYLRIFAVVVDLCSYLLSYFSMYFSISFHLAPFPFMCLVSLLHLYIRINLSDNLANSYPAPSRLAHHEHGERCFSPQLSSSL